MITNMISFILGACAMRFIAEKEWWCVIILMVLEAMNLFAKYKTEDKGWVYKHIIKKAAYIYVLLLDEELTTGMLPEVKKAIASACSEIAATILGIDGMGKWIKICSEIKQGFKEKKHDKS